MRFEDLGLRAEILRALHAKNYDTPTPVQAQAIPLVLNGHDVRVSAQTGTGKTAAFSLPILHKLSQTAPKGQRKPRALVLTPTRELAHQVGDSVKTYGAQLKLVSTMVYGGVGFQPQADRLRRGVDILVATPGRLLDHASQRTVDLSCVEMLILDEADRMLDMGFIPDIRRIMKLLPEQRQNMLFSATYSDDMRRLVDTFLNDPKIVEVATRNKPADLVRQVVHPVSKGRKRDLLSHLIGEGDWSQVLVFTRTKHGADRLARQLKQDGIAADAIHGDKSQGARMKALTAFKARKMRVLVATDVASRGLDIDQLPHVVNFDLPHVPEDYVHRIGRTGRAGAEGIAVSLVSAEEDKQLRDIERLLKKSIDSEEIAGFEGERLPGQGFDPTAPVRRHAPGTRRMGMKRGAAGGGGGRRAAVRW